jgi:TPR repeat protein
MNTLTQMSLSDIRIMILCDFPLSTEECGHLFYDGDGVIKNREEAYVWYRIAQFSGNHSVDCLVNYLNSRIMKSTSNKLSSRAKHIYARALLH